MPRPGPRRPHTGVRLDTELLARLDRYATQHGINRSEAIRQLLTEALNRHRPRGNR